MKRANYKPLSSRLLKAGASYHWPSSKFMPVHADSPALQVMTDLDKVSAATISIDATLSQSTQKMAARGVRLLLVTHYNGDILGVITARDMVGERPVNHLRQNGGKHSDLTVRDFMTPLEKIEVLSFADVERAKVGQIIATLKESGRQHAIVADTNAHGDDSICGIFSITQIGRQLGMVMVAFDVSKTFAEIEATLAAQPQIIRTGTSSEQNL